MDTDAQIFRNNFSAAGTLLGGASGVNEQYGTTGAFSLVRGVLDELAPGHICNVAVDNAVIAREHVRDVQLLKDHKLIVVDQLAAFLMRKVGTPIRGTLVGMVKSMQYLKTFGSSLIEVFLLPLEPGNVVGVPFHPALALNLGTIGKHGERFQTKVDTNGFGVGRKRFGLDLTREAGVPLTVTTPNGDGLDSSLNRPVQLNLDRANLRERQDVAIELHAITVLRASEAVIVHASLKAGVSGLIARLNTAEESLKRQVNSCHGVLEHLRVDIRQFRLIRLPSREQLRSGVVAQCLTTLFVGILTGSQRLVIDKTAQLKRLGELVLLGFSRLETVFEPYFHMFKYTTNTLKLVVLAPYIPIPEGRGFTAQRR